MCFELNSCATITELMHVWKLDTRLVVVLSFKHFRLYHAHHHPLVILYESETHLNW